MNLGSILNNKMFSINEITFMETVFEYVCGFDGISFRIFTDKLSPKSDMDKICVLDMDDMSNNIPIDSKMVFNAVRFEHKYLDNISKCLRVDIDLEMLTQYQYDVKKIYNEFIDETYRLLPKGYGNKVYYNHNKMLVDIHDGLKGIKKLYDSEQHKTITLRSKYNIKG